MPHFAREFDSQQYIPRAHATGEDEHVPNAREKEEGVILTVALDGHEKACGDELAERKGKAKLDFA